MPIYEYECENCHHQFEKLIFGTERKDVVCPQCGGGNSKKLLSECGFIGGKSAEACSEKPSKGFS